MIQEELKVNWIFHKNVIQVFKDKSSYHTGNDQVQYNISIDIAIQATHMPDLETQTVSLGIPDNEPIENAENEMEEFARNSINDWND